MFALSVLFLVALAAGALGGLVGTGSSLVLLPILVTMYGPRIAVPIMGIAAVMANVGRSRPGGDRFVGGQSLPTRCRAHRQP